MARIPASVVVKCASIFWITVLKWMPPPDRKYMLSDVDLAFKLPVAYEAFQKPMNSELLL